MKIDSHLTSSIDDCRVVDISTVSHENGRIAFMENSNGTLFDIKRVYYIYDLPAGAERGGHSHRDNKALIIALSGSFDVVVDDGHLTKRVTLNRPDRGFYLGTGIWRTLDNFSSGAVCLVLASEKYDAGDYVRDYDEFKRLTKDKIAK